MNHIRAFYSLPENPDSCPTFLNLAGNFMLFPIIYFTTDSVVITRNETNRTYTELTTLRKEPIYFEALFLLLLIPSIVLGTLLKITSYINPDVRLQHRSVKNLHEQVLNPKLYN